MIKSPVKVAGITKKIVSCDLLSIKLYPRYQMWRKVSPYISYNIFTPVHSINIIVKFNLNIHHIFLKYTCPVIYFTCPANSLVGSRIKALNFLQVSPFRRLCMMGRTKATVLPEPVGAHANRSRPWNTSMIKGIICCVYERCIELFLSAV